MSATDVKQAGADLGAGLTAALGAFAASFRDAPPAALAIARTGIIDGIGVMLAARNESVVRAARNVLLEDGAALPAGQGASVLLSTQRARAGDAAFINAVATHAYAMDDVAAGCHPSAMLMPALIAQAQVSGATGRDVLRAWVVGYEVLAELAAREPDPLHSTGWHPSGQLGPPAVAAAVCNLMGCDADTATRAIAIAASMTGGLFVNFGTQTKALHAGRISSTGILATRLAREGVTASRDALEREAGLLRTISPNKQAVITGGFARGADNLRLLENGLCIKKYPVCYSLHRIADAAIDVASQPGCAVDQIDSVAIVLGKTQAWMADKHNPQTAMEAKYCIEFTVAAGLVARAAGFAQLEQAFIRHPDVQRLMAAATIAIREDVSADDTAFCKSDRVAVKLRDGRVFDSGEVPYARGHAKLPLDDAALRVKFVDCVTSGGRADGAALFDQLQGFAELRDLNVL